MGLSPFISFDIQTCPRGSQTADWDTMSRTVRRSVVVTRGASMKNSTGSPTPTKVIVR